MRGNKSKGVENLKGGSASRTDEEERGADATALIGMMNLLRLRLRLRLRPPSPHSAPPTSLTRIQTPPSALHSPPSSRARKGMKKEQQDSEARKPIQSTNLTSVPLHLPSHVQPEYDSNMVNKLPPPCQTRRFRNFQTPDSKS